MRRAILIASIMTILGLQAAAQDFNSQLRRSIVHAGYVPIIPTVQGPAPGDLVQYCGKLQSHFEANPSGELPADKLKTVGMTMADTSFSRNLTIDAFFNNLAQLLAGSINAKGSMQKTVSIKQIDADGQSLAVVPNEIASDEHVLSEYQKMKQQKCKLLIVDTVYTTKSIDFQIDTTVDVAGGYTQANGSSALPDCTSTSQSQSGSGLGAAVCVKNSTHLVISSATPRVFAVTLSEMTGPGLTKPAKVSIGIAPIPMDMLRAQ